MQIHRNASTLLVSLILIASLLSIIFLSKDRLLHQERLGVYYTEQYLLDRYRLLPIFQQDKNAICQNSKKKVVQQADLAMPKSYFAEYRFLCQFYSLFRDKKPTKEKYISFQKIDDYLDLTNVPKQEIYVIHSLAELPDSTESDPKIVVVQNAINDTLSRNFYGIVITDYLFDITGKKMYGVLYSSYDNVREERNLTFKKEVIANLDAKYAYWRYLSDSQHLMGAVEDE